MSTSTTSIELDQLEAGILYESKEIERVLYQLNREVYQIKWIDAFKEGWRTIESRHGKNRTLAYKVGTVFGSITIVIPLSGASIMFGALALKLGVRSHARRLAITGDF